MVAAAMFFSSIILHELGHWIARVLALIAYGVIRLLGGDCFGRWRWL